MEDHWNFDLDTYLDEDPICVILANSYKDYNLDFKKEVKIRYAKNRNHKQVISDVCRDFNEIIQEYYSAIS